MRFVITILASLSFLVASDAEAVPPRLKPSGLKIVGFPKEGRLEVDGSGHYADLMRDVIAEAGYSDQLLIVPVKRAMRMFRDQPDVCLMPSAKFSIIGQGYAKNREELIQSSPLDYITGHLVTLPGSKPLSGTGDLEGRIVGAWSGLKVAALMPGENFELLKTESEVSAIRMLISGRVDVIWGWVPDSFILFERLGLGEPVLSETALVGASAHIVCKRMPASEAAMPNLNRAIDAMREDGRMKQTLGKYSRVVGVDVPMSFTNPE